MKTADPELMRAINRFHVVDTIRRFGPIARVEICGRTELSPTTVSAITATLLDDGLIVPSDIAGVRELGARDGTRDEAARGRPRVKLALNPDAAYVVGVKLSADQITVATTNFRADVLESLSLPVRVDRQSAAVIADLVEDGVRRSVADAGLAIAQVAGICVGLPGIVAREGGVCRSSPPAGSAYRCRSTPTPICWRSPSTGSGAAGISTTSWWCRRSTRSASASSIAARCCARRAGCRPASATT
jgi:hypothetical protein